MAGPTGADALVPVAGPTGADVRNTLIALARSAAAVSVAHTVLVALDPDRTGAFDARLAADPARPWPGR